jgi:hypothetical protein
MSFATWLLSYAFNKSEEGWLLVQSGNEYELEPVDYDPSADAYVIERGDDEDKEYYEDNLGMMHSLFGVPIGLVTDEQRPIVDADSARKAAAADQKVTDGGMLDPQETMPVQDVMNRMKVGTVQTQSGIAHLVNPWHHKDDEPDIVDIRPTMRLFRHDARPDTPRKAAKNAVEAERATDGLNVGKLTDWVQIVGSFLMGAIVTEYIAGSSGGGGGVEIPVTLGFDALVQTLPYLSQALGYL